MLKTKTTVQEVAWNLNLRTRVGDSVLHNGSTWSNVTGKNSEPGTGSDWNLITPMLLTLEISGNVFGLVKHSNNEDLQSLEVNDMIVNGWWGDQEFWPMAIYLGGSKEDIASWNPISPVEEIPLL